MTAFDVIQGPLITEKAEGIRALQHTMCFRVHPKATKTDIKHAVFKIFKVKVAEVRTANYLGKMRRRGRYFGYRAKWKKSLREAARGREDG